MILAHSHSSFRVVTKIMATWPPIRVLTTTSHPGIPKGYEAELRFDGNTYPITPSMPSARRLNGNIGIGRRHTGVPMIRSAG
jgi:hypothetical protein